MQRAADGCGGKGLRTSGLQTSWLQIRYLEKAGLLFANHKTKVASQVSCKRVLSVGWTYPLKFVAFVIDTN